VGTEFTFLVPVIDEAALEAELDDGSVGADVEFAGDSLRELQYSPRLWVGAKRDCWGVVGRFWFLDACESESTLDFLTDDLFGYDVRSELEMYTIDLEVTRDLRLLACSRDVASAGVRYASYGHEGRLVSLSDVITDSASFTSLASFSQITHGIGLTGALSGTRPICGSCVSYFYGARGSLLWGDSDVAALTQVSVNDGAGNQVAAINEVGVSSEDPFAIVELQLGLQAEHRLKSYPASAFLRTAFEFQHWTGDNGSAAALMQGTAGNSEVTTLTRTDGLDANLYGFSVATGVTF
jgi:hypothetical protein